MASRTRYSYTGKIEGGFGPVTHDVRVFFFFQAEDGIRDYKVTGVQTCALPIFPIFRVASSARAIFALTSATISTGLSDTRFSSSFLYVYESTPNRTVTSGSTSDLAGGVGLSIAMLPARASLIASAFARACSSGMPFRSR